ncbi:sorting nexin-15-like [Dendrobates tinctorius]|uniref:sorting nexin-15-like n=1 Tax=Dendrobates tinctorius TaxID=92724 RepID=UPI003CC9E10B
MVDTRDCPQAEPSQIDLLFDLGEDLCQTLEEDPANPAPAPKPLDPNDLALFDPCYAEDGALSETESSLNLLSVRCKEEELAPAMPLGEGDGAPYLSQATAEVQQAMDRESSGDYAEAFRLFRNAVDILLKGVKDDHCPDRRESVRRRTAEYLHHADLQDHMGGSIE